MGKGKSSILDIFGLGQTLFPSSSSPTNPLTFCLMDLLPDFIQWSNHKEITVLEIKSIGIDVVFGVH